MERLIRKIKLVSVRAPRPACILVLIVSFGFLLRLYMLGLHSLWHDEAMSLYVLQDFSSIMKFRPFVNPPLFGFLLYFWKSLGDSELVLRLLPFLFGVSAVVMMYVTGKTFFDRKTGLLGAFLLAISPFHIYYSQELRAYTLAAFLALVSIFYLYQSLKKNNFFSWCCFVAFTALSMYSHDAAPFLFVTENIFFLFFLKRYFKLLPKWLISQCVIFLLYVPLFISNVDLIINARLLDTFFWTTRLSPVVFLNTFNIFNLGYTASMPVYFFSFLIFAALFLNGLRARNRKKEEIFLLLLWLFIPIFLSAAVSLTMKINSIYIYRTFLFVLPAYLLIVAAGFTGIKRYIALPLFGGIVFFSSLSLYNYYHDTFPLPVKPYHPGISIKKEIKPAVDYIISNFKEGDAVAHTCRATFGPFLFYSKGKFENRWITYNQNSMNSREWYYFNIMFSRIARNNRITLTPEPIDIDQFVKGKKRIWLVLSGWNLDFVKSRRIERWLDRNCNLLDSKNFIGIKICLYECN